MKFEPYPVSVTPAASQNGRKRSGSAAELNQNVEEKQLDEGIGDTFVLIGLGQEIFL